MRDLSPWPSPERELQDIAGATWIIGEAHVLRERILESGLVSARAAQRGIQSASVPEERALWKRALRVPCSGPLPKVPLGQSRETPRSDHQARREEVSGTQIWARQPKTFAPRHQAASHAEPPQAIHAAASVRRALIGTPNGIPQGMLPETLRQTSCIGHWHLARDGLGSDLLPHIPFCCGVTGMLHWSEVPDIKELSWSRVVTSLPVSLATLLARMWGAGRSWAPWMEGGHKPPLTTLAP